ncbi:hypothetical protein RND81_11G103300 [Saponaria officinalis]|uniref:Uncharacterized protein n=1 Tax=Saponaria officinalis TaxID=3572 RepID=A0AAW1HM27_SAPOF
MKDNKLIPAEPEVWIPDDTEVRANWRSVGWLAIHEVAFREGCRLPFTHLMAAVIDELKVSPFQLMVGMVAVWELVHSVEAICRRHKLIITIDDLKHYYHLRTSGQGRITFRLKDKVPQLIGNFDAGNDKGWIQKNLFVRNDLISPG